MKTLSVSYAADRIVFTDDKGQSEVIFTETPDTADVAIRVLKKDIEARSPASRAALSVLLQVLNNPRLDGYRGKTPMNEKIPAVFKSALREAEDDYLKPKFFDAMKGNDSQKQVAWDNFIKGVREPGSYANARSVAIKFFAQLGMLPCIYENGSPDMSRLLPVSAMLKLLANAKAQNPAETDGIVQDIVKVETRVDNEHAMMTLDEVEASIRAASALMLKLEALRFELNEQATEHAQNIMQTAVAVAQAAPALV